MIFSGISHGYGEEVVILSIALSCANKLSATRHAALMAQML